MFTLFTILFEAVSGRSEAGFRSLLCPFLPDELGQVLAIPLCPFPHLKVRISVLHAHSMREAPRSMSPTDKPSVVAGFLQFILLCPHTGRAPLSLMRISSFLLVEERWLPLLQRTEYLVHMRCSIFHVLLFFRGPRLACSAMPRFRGLLLAPGLITNHDLFSCLLL